MHENVAAVQRALRAAGALGEVRELAVPARTAAEAAAALNCPVGAIANSLVFAADGAPVLVLTSGAHRVDTRHLAGVIGVAALRRASAELVREATGQPIGGVAPLGHPAPLPTFIDVALEAYPVVWAAGGIPHAIFPTTYGELRRICSATEVTVQPATE